MSPTFTSLPAAFTPPGLAVCVAVEVGLIGGLSVVIPGLKQPQFARFCS